MNTLAALLLSITAGASNTPVDDIALLQRTGSVAMSTPAPSVANRTGSRRVGGYPKRGQGSRYAGGRRTS